MHRREFGNVDGVFRRVERGCAMRTLRAAHLNPNHPGWYRFATAFDAYRKHDYRGALGIALKINTRGLWGTNLVLAVTYGQLGEHEKARGRRARATRSDAGICY
jgi:hypothetical protein